jgi:hypothetical protein
LQGLPPPFIGRVAGGLIGYSSIFDRKGVMNFEWDAMKACLNQRKHGVSFQEATEVFGDDYSSCIRDPDHSQEEDRYLLWFNEVSRGSHKM